MGTNSVQASLLRGALRDIPKIEMAAKGTTVRFRPEDFLGFNLISVPAAYDNCNG